MENPELAEKKAKAKKYATEPERFNFTSFEIKMNSTHDERTITYSDGQWGCTCDFYHHNGTCSHIMALQILLNDFNLGQNR